MACFDVWDIGACGCGTGPCPPCVTCGSSNMPCTFFVHDINSTSGGGPYSAVWNSGLGLWITANIEGPNGGATTYIANCVGGVATCWPPLTGGGFSALYFYTISCTSAGHMTINRNWYQIACTSPTEQAVPFGCGIGTGVQVHTTSGSVAVTCGSISWSGTLGGSTGLLSDIVFGTTSFSQ